MKKLLLLLIIPFLSFGQERINKSNIKFISKSKKLSKAIGWNYSEELGEWRSCKNCIPEYRGTHINYYDKKKPNFKSIQFAQVESSDNYILIIKFREVSTCNSSPGNITVVESNCSIIAGPESFVPILIFVLS